MEIEYQFQKNSIVTPYLNFIFSLLLDFLNKLD